MFIPWSFVDNVCSSYSLDLTSKKLYQVKCESRHRNRSAKISDKILYATKDIFRNRFKRVIETGEKRIHFENM